MNQQEREVGEGWEHDGGGHGWRMASREMIKL